MDSTAMDSTAMNSTVINSTVINRTARDSSANNKPTSDESLHQAWRTIPFGSEENHIEVDFNTAAPQSVTSVLCACLRDANQQAPSADQIWLWPITTRLQGLLTVVRATHNSPLSVDTECPACQERLSFELPLEDFLQDNPKEALHCALANGDSVQLRVPSGLDQQRWLQQGDIDPKAIVQDLLIDVDALSSVEHGMENIEAALKEADPLTSLELETQCPDCQTNIRYPFNLEMNLLQRLRAVLSDTLRNVHRLALSYHWSEAEILNLPLQRRDFYLACLRREE